MIGRVQTICVPRWLCAVVLHALPLTATAAPQITVANTDGRSGAMAEITVSLIGAEVVTGLQFDLRFDPNRVTVGEIKPGPGSASHRIESRRIGDDRIRVVAYSMALVNFGGGAIVQVPVTWTSRGNSALQVEDAQSIGADGAKVAVTVASTATHVGASGRIWLVLVLIPVLATAGWWFARRRVQRAASH